MAVDVCNRVKVKRNSFEYEGVIMPSQTGNLVLKLDNGYNIGLCRSGLEIMEVPQEEQKPVSKPTEVSPGTRGDLPPVAILSTGGTIASKVDYRTGAVTSQFTAGDILTSIPELTEIANFDARVIYSILSENMRPSYWVELASAAYEEIKKGVRGIIVTHGTDTMTYTAAALSFLIETPIPIVLVGSQRSADRPSSDNAMNAICAATVATSDIAEVSVVMHGGTSDEFCHIHRGTKVRKMHTSRRDAFRSINAKPIGRVEYPTRRLIIETADYIKRGEKKPVLHKELESRCILLKYPTGASPDVFDHFIEAGYKGVVLEGTGLGHVSTEWVPVIQKATKEGIPVVITSQCVSGRVCDRVYDTGRDMLRAGAIEGEDMLPEVAFVKLMWALGKTDDLDEVKNIMRTNVAGEISRSTRVSAY